MYSERHYSLFIQIRAQREFSWKQDLESQEHYTRELRLALWRYSGLL